MDDIKEHMHKLRTKIQERSGLLLQAEHEGLSQKELKEDIESKEEQLAELQVKMDDAYGLPRRSEQPSAPTEKMLIYQKEELSKKEKRLLSLYEQWKMLIRKSKQNLKTNISEAELATMADNIEKGMNDIIKVYSEMRVHATPSTELRRKMDACEAVTSDLLRVIYERLSAIDGEFDADIERQHLHQLHANDYAYSVYGSASQSGASHRSETASIVAKRIDAAAELAAKEAQFKIIQVELKQKEKIRTMEEQHRKELDMQRSELERIQAEKDMEAAPARLMIYDREIRMETDIQPTQQSNGSSISIPSDHHQNPHIVAPAPHTDVSQLAQAIQESIAMNRLPMPVPTVFSGDPILYIEWRASFMSLIDRKGISSADKLNFLKKYVTGSAHKCLEGTFYRNDDEAYRDAWKKLDQRYGQPFVVQRAFREKLSKWPKINSKDAEGLRTFSDFLNACLQAIPHVKRLEILSDCEENQKLIQKVPDWLAARWNRQVTVKLMEGKDFPSFKDFANFVNMEAEIACNPVTSLHALHSSNTFHDKGSSKEIRGNKANVLTMQTITNTDKAGANNVKSKPLCMCCKDDKHQLPRCPDFTRKSLKERRSYVME